MWLISDAWAQDTAAQPNPLYQVAFMLVMVAVLYLLLIRPQQKRAKEQRAMMEALKSGETTILLSPDSEFFRYFNNLEGRRP